MVYENMMFRSGRPEAVSRSRCRCPVLSQDGIALVMVLVLSAIALAVMAALMYILTSGTQTSGIQKRYKTALDAGAGGLDITYQVIAFQGGNNGNGTGNPFDSITRSALSLQIPATNVSGVDCLTAKLTSLTNDPTTPWPAACSKTTAIDPGTQSTYDIRMDLGGGYRVYAKIVDTVPGNSAATLFTAGSGGAGGGSRFKKGGVVWATASGGGSNTSSSETKVMSIPYLYTIEVDSENLNNPNERAKLSVLYQY